MYRYFNGGNKDHFYTTNWGELRGGGGAWTYQGVAGYVPSAAASGTANLYRYFDTGNGDHFYTQYWQELGAGGGSWNYEGVQSQIFVRPDP